MLGFGVVPLSAETKRRVLAVFPSELADEAERLLVEGCAENLPLIHDPTPLRLERWRFAAIRLSGGSVERLQQAIEIAQHDWRDLLVWAGFADDVHAHERWEPRRFDSPVLDQWTRRAPLAGVRFSLDASVQVISPSKHGGQRGRVVTLLGIEPEPRYLVELESGERMESLQRSLADA